MKYILKKDLPFAKAGTEVKLMSSRLGGQSITYEVDPVNGARFWIADISLLISEGWIEEVKPREWIINLGEDGAVILKDGKMIYKFGRTDTALVESIKVREVIE